MHVSLLHTHCRDKRLCPSPQLQRVYHFSVGFRVDHAGTGARVGGLRVPGAGVKGVQAPKPLSDAAAPDDVEGSQSAHALAKSSGTKGGQSYREMLCLLHCVQHFEHAICTCEQQLCAVSSYTSCMRSWSGSQHINHSVCQCALLLLILLHGSTLIPS